MALTHDQVVHLHDIKRAFDRAVSIKYVKGATEHGGNIWDQSELALIDNALDEVIDQYVYLRTLRDKIAARIT